MHKSAPQSDINDHRDLKKLKPHLHEAFNFKFFKIHCFIEIFINLHSFSSMNFVFEHKNREKERDRE